MMGWWPKTPLLDAPSWHSALGWGPSFCTWKEKEGAEAGYPCGLMLPSGFSPQYLEYPMGSPSTLGQLVASFWTKKKGVHPKGSPFLGVRFLNPYSKLFKPYPAQYAQSTSRIAHVGVHKHPLSLQLFLGPDAIDPGAHVRFTSVNVWRC